MMGRQLGKAREEIQGLCEP